MMGTTAARFVRLFLIVEIPVVAALIVAPPADAASTETSVRAVANRALRITYQVNPAAMPIESVALWYTTDLGQSWVLQGYDYDLRSPFEFEAPAEGLYGFFLVIRNRVGQSSADPAPGTEPQQKILVDLGPPLLQAHTIARMGGERSRRFHIRWTAYDAHFGARPIGLEYQLANSTEWHVIAREPPSSEQFDWVVPESVGGPVTVRLSANDLAGNVTTVHFSPIEVEYLHSGSTGFPDESATRDSDHPSVSPPTAAQPAQEPLLSSEDAARVAALLNQARWNQDRGEWAVARQRLSEVLTTAPQNVNALKSLAGIDYRTGDYRNALRAWDDVLRLRADDTDAMRGRALTEVALHEYEAAAASLAQILRNRPGDAETLLSLGDVLLMMGRREQARTTWENARSTSRQDPDAARKASKRLRLYPPNGF